MRWPKFFSRHAGSQLQVVFPESGELSSEWIVPEKGLMFLGLHKVLGPYE